MTSAGGDDRPPIRVVLADANVLYSRVLGDYLLYAATQGALEIRWSAAILAEVVAHISADALLSLLVTELPHEILAAHRLAVSHLPGATDESTLAALRRAGGNRTADLVGRLLDS